MRMVVEECSKLGIEQLTLYCLSSENWKRPASELTLLMHLLRQFVIEERGEIMRQNLQFSLIGRRSELPDNVLQEVEATIECSRANSGMRLCLAVNYGSRAEVTDAVRAIAGRVARGEQSVEDIDEQVVSDSLYTAGMPDPDLVVRTAGEMRLSNFLLWQISYAELWVTSRCWPEFRRDDLRDALREFSGRDRRFGGLTG